MKTLQSPPNQILFAQIEPTTHCNFTCGFCCGRQMDQTHLSLAHFKQFLQRFPSIRQLELQGEGEPFIHPEFFTMVTIAEMANIHISLITNGSCFSRSVVDKLLNSQIRAIRVSLETTDPNAFQRLRGGAWESVRAGIIRLRDARNERGQDRPSIGFAVTVLDSTLDDLPKIYALYEQLGLDGGVAIQSLNRMPYYIKHSTTAVQMEHLTAAQHGARYQMYLNSDAARRIWQTRSAHAHFYDELFKPRPADKEKGRLAVCPWLDSGIYLDRQGRLSPCCMIKPETWPLGDLDTLTDAVLYDTRRQLAEELAVKRIPEPCNGCNVAWMIVN
jgi:MoaA/NifB/PqqE/SkfB family radical SAM enzyme